MVVGLRQDDADDLVQNALVALWERREEVPPPAWGTWLVSAITLRRTEMFRHREIREKHAPRVAWEMELDAPEASGDPEEQLGRAEVAALMKEIIGALPPERQAIVQAYLLEEQSMADAAAKLGIAVPTAWDRWQRAKREIQEQIVRLRERERFKAGVVSFGVLLALAARIRAFFGERFGAAMVGLHGTKPAVALAAVLALAATSHAGPPSPDSAARSSAVQAVMRSAGVLATAPRGLSGWAARTARAQAVAVREIVRSAPAWPDSAHSRLAGAGPSGRGAEDGQPARRRSARTLLVRAGDAAYVLKDPALARSLLDRYEHLYPERPYAGHHASLAGRLNAH